MHEFALYDTVSQDDYGRVRQQLAGVARMQPRKVTQVHLLFRARPPVGLANLPSAGGSQGVMQQDVQRIKTMLNASLYYLQLIGESIDGELSPTAIHSADGDVSMTDPDVSRQNAPVPLRWMLEFKDTPDPGKQSVSSRLISRTLLEGGNMVRFLENFGYEYVSRYYVRGCQFYDQDTTLFLHEIFQLPQAVHDDDTVDMSSMPSFASLIPVDPGRKHLLQVSIDVTDGNHPGLKDRAIKQLLAIKNTLRQVVTLTPGDRLALDTKVPTARRA